MIMNQALFRGMTNREADETMRCLKAVRKEYSKDSYIHHAGDIISSLAIIESGSVLIVQEDFWGNRNIIMEATANESFGEVFAVTRTPLSVSVVAKSDVTILLIDTDRIMSPCSRQCASHTTLISNLLEDIARKNIKLNEKLTHVGKRTTRDKILSYLSAEAGKSGSDSFDIPYNRQQLADYLYVDRCGLSTELSKLQNENLIRFNKNHFKLLL